MSSLEVDREVGRVAGLWRYPVKSMAGEALESAGVGWHGVEGKKDQWTVQSAHDIKSFSKSSQIELIPTKSPQSTWTRIHGLFHE